MRQFVAPAHGLIAAVLVLGFVAEASAAAPRGMLFQRRGSSRYTMTKPSPVDSSPTIATLNKALKALGATDRSYEGHREKAITHIGSAIQHLELSTARGKSNAAVEKASNGQPAVATKTATTPEAASDESLHKAKTILFSVHHKLTDHTSTRGQIHADAQVRLAIDEIVAALKLSTFTPPAEADSASTTTTTSTNSDKPAK